MDVARGDNRANGSANGIGADTQNFTIGLQLQVPIYQGGAISSRERERQPAAGVGEKSTK